MPFIKTACAPVLVPELQQGQWQDNKSDILCSQGVCRIGSRRVKTAEKAIKTHTSDKFLLSHVSIMASVDTEVGSDPKVTFPDYKVTPQTASYMNNNGDVWEKKLLLTTFRSFIGSENYVEHCAPPGTRVLMSGGEFKSIEDVKIGDMVISHTGKIRKVLDVMKNSFQGELTSLKPWGSPRDLAFTGGHPFRTCDGGNEFKWVNAEEVQKGEHWLVQPKLQGVVGPSEDISLGKAYLIGMFLAEGCFWKYKGEKRGVQFSLGWHEEHTFAKKTFDLLEVEFRDEIDQHRLKVPQNRGVRMRTNVSSLIDPKSNASCCVDCNVAYLALFFEKYCCEYAKTKKLPEEVLRWPLDLQEQVLQGWIDGDGGVTSSVTLANQMRIIGHRLGYAVMYDCTMDTCVALNFKDVKSGKTLLHYTEDCKPQSGYSRVVPCDEGFAAKVRKIKKIPYDGFVYNLEVGEDNSYIVEGFAVHNCQNPLLSKGKIIDAVSREVPVYDSVTGQPLRYASGAPVTTVYVDILVATSRKYAKLVESIQRGETNAMSMGCLLKYTICSECGKVIYRDVDACEHIQFNKGGTHTDDQGITRITTELCGHASDEKSCEFIEASWVAVPAFRGAVRRNVLNMDERKFAGQLKIAQNEAVKRFHSIYKTKKSEMPQAKVASFHRDRLAKMNSQVLTARICEIVKWGG